MLPQDKCGSSGTPYIYSSRADAAQACQNEGCSGLADWEEVGNPTFVWQKKSGPSYTNGERCAAMWWATQVTPVSGDMAWWMRSGDGSGGCGFTGWNKKLLAPAAAACIGCPAIQTCPPPPPALPAPPAPPPTPPSPPPIQPMEVKISSGCQTHLTETECRSVSGHQNKVMEILNTAAAMPGCYKYINPFGYASMYYNQNLTGARTCAESGFSCYCGEDPVDVTFGFSQVVACNERPVRVAWSGFHNIQETSGSACNSGDVGAPIAPYHSSKYVEVFTTLSAAPGQTRYFKCSSHCGASANRFEVSCPA